MQPCSREMQSLNSLFNSSSSSEIPIPLQNQIQINNNNNNNDAFNHHHDDFLKQILSTNLPPSWNTLDPNNKPLLWDPNSDENVTFPNYDEQHNNLASKFRNHQITDKTAAALMLLTADSGGLLHMPADFDSSQNDVVNTSSVSIFIFSHSVN